MAMMAAACSGSSDGTDEDREAGAEASAEQTPDDQDGGGDGAQVDLDDGEPSKSEGDGQGDDEGDSETGDETSEQPGQSGANLATIDPDFEVQVGVEQLTVLGATPDTPIAAVDADRTDLDDAADTLGQTTTSTVDAYGSLVLRGLDADTDYRLVTPDGATEPFDVLARDEHPDPAFFAEQRLEINRDATTGFDYIETRDGTTLGAYIVLPGPIEDGPYPTVVEYSGYSPSDPSQGPGFPTLFSSLGYAYVGVNVRGTGCSGGSFRYFEYAQSTDGYDVVEAVAAQPWVADNKVGMVGISYPGISQLFVAQTQPPSLTAITPVSVLDDSTLATLYPGGILNTGFAVNWTQERVESARASIAPDGSPTDEGQGWTLDEIDAGDDECAANQGVRLQNPDLIAEVFDTPFYDPALGDDLAPWRFVDKITVPTFLAGAWQDEQTGGRFPVMLDRFTGTDHLYVSMLNGLHTESISPAVLPRLIEFLDLYVKEETPNLDPLRGIGPVLANGLYGTDQIGDPQNRFAGMSYEDALAAFEAEPSVQVLFEQGAADGYEPRTPLPRFVESFEAWPIPEVEATTWYLGPEETLLDEPGSADAVSQYLALPDGVPATFWDGDSSALWRTDVTWDWQEPAPGTFADFRTDPLAETLTMVGSASADLWVNSNLGDTDLEVTLTELRPDGTEVMVQSGWLRASHRALDEDESTPLRPVHTHLEADAAPLPEPGDAGDTEFALARVEIFPFAHVFRAGSQVRLMIDAPGGNRAVWVFDTIANGEAVQIGMGPTYPSQLVLPVVPGIEPPAEYPPCDSLRGQPCRAPR